MLPTLLLFLSLLPQAAWDNMHPEFAERAKCGVSFTDIRVRQSDGRVLSIGGKWVAHAEVYRSEGLGTWAMTVAETDSFKSAWKACGDFQEEFTKRVKKARGE